MCKTTRWQGGTLGPSKAAPRPQLPPQIFKKKMTKKPKGWRQESYRHKLAAKGIKTKKKRPVKTTRDWRAEQDRWEQTQQIKSDRSNQKYYISELRKTFEKYQDKDDWKNNAEAIVDSEKEAIKVADSFEYFHGTKPKIEEIPTIMKHKEGLVTFQGKPKYRVYSEGYVY